MKKIHWIEKSEKAWKLILKVGDELFRIRINTMNKYDITYSLYKYEKYNDADEEWTADINRSKTIIKSRTPIIVLRSIDTICQYHIESLQPDNIVFTVNKRDDNSEKKMRLYQHFSNKLKKLNFRVISTEQLDCYAFIAVRKDSSLYEKPANYFQLKFHQIQFDMNDLSI